MLVAQLGVVAYLVAIGFFTPAMLVTLPRPRRRCGACTTPTSTRARWKRRPTLPKGVWPLYFVAVTFWYNRRFGMFFLLGLVGDIVLSRL